jgi:hypothetical protein
MNLQYLLLRGIRHFMPAPLVRLLLRRKLVIRPGMETSRPEAAVERYQAALAEVGRSFDGKRVLVLGYGGSFAVGCALLDCGAQHVVLCDPFAPPDHQRNQQLISQYSAYLSLQGDQVIPDPKYITLYAADIRLTSAREIIQQVDLVVSSSVYEHLDDVDGITRALAQITCADGMGLHFVDLRDHFFRYPFEMLRFSSAVWSRWLNPTSNLNRCRLWDYRRVFASFFQQVEIKIIRREDAAFAKARNSIRPEFLSGNAEEDGAAVIRVMVGAPIPSYSN